jgi:hypothetical protein
MAVVNRAGALLWERLQRGETVAARPGAAVHDFLNKLEEAGLVRRAAIPAAGNEPDTRGEPPRLLHTGAVETLVYGSTGGPWDKPIFGDPATPQGKKTDWPFDDTRK